MSHGDAIMSYHDDHGKLACELRPCLCVLTMLQTLYADISSDAGLLTRHETHCDCDRRLSLGRSSWECCRVQTSS